VSRNKGEQSITEDLGFSSLESVGFGLVDIERRENVNKGGWNGVLKECYPGFLQLYVFVVDVVLDLLRVGFRCLVK